MQLPLLTLTPAGLSTLTVYVVTLLGVSTMLLKASSKLCSAAAVKVNWALAPAVLVLRFWDDALSGALLLTVKASEPVPKPYASAVCSSSTV